jgi:hypothetical protein
MAPMTKRIRGIALISTFLALCFTFISCDSGGESSSSPEWVGNWEVVAFDDGEAPDEPEYWAITEDEFDIVTNDEGGGCTVSEGEIIESGGNVVTVDFEGGEGGDEVIEISLDVSGETMTGNIVESTEGGVGNETTVESINSNPRDLACP